MTLSYLAHIAKTNMFLCKSGPLRMRQHYGSVAKCYYCMHELRMQKPEWNFLRKTPKGMRPGRAGLRAARARKLSVERESRSALCAYRIQKTEIGVSDRSQKTEEIVTYHVLASENPARNEGSENKLVYFHCPSE